jgi:hypothetical protein
MKEVTPQMNSSKDSIEEKLTPAQRETIKSLESISTDWRIRFNLILTFFRQKTATDLLLDIEILEEEIERIRKIIEKANLLFKDMGRGLDNIYKTERGKRVCYVAINQEDLDLISSPNNRGDREMGRMSGFPQSAIDAFVSLMNKPDSITTDIWKQRHALSPEEKRERFSDEEYAFSTFFMMSRANWQEELETVRRWVKIIKQADFNLYQEIINERK